MYGIVQVGAIPVLSPIEGYEMRSVHFLPIACALALFSTAAHAQKIDPEWTVKADSASIVARGTLDHQAEVVVTPIVVNSNRKAAVSIWLTPYRDRGIELYEPKGSHEDDYMVRIALPKALPQPFAVQIVGIGLRRLYDSKRLRKEPSYGYKLPGANEKKAMIKFSWQY